MVHKLDKARMPKIVDGVSSWSRSKDDSWILTLKKLFDGSSYPIALPVMIRATAGLRGAVASGELDEKDVESFEQELTRQM